MFLQFSVRNFRSLRDEQTLDLRATAKKELPEVVRHPEGMDGESRGVLPVAAVFGANASGKTSLFLAANTLRELVLGSESEAIEGRGVLETIEPFRFDPALRKAEVRFNVVFLREGVRHEYGVVILPRQDERRFARVTSEWLRSWPKGHPVDVFLRGEAARADGRQAGWWVSEDGFAGGRRLAADLFQQTRDDVLFVSLASKRNQSQAKAVVSWFGDDFRTSLDFTRGPLASDTQTRSLAQPEFAEYVSRLMRAADTGIEAVETVRLARTDDYPVRIGGRFVTPPAHATRTWHRDSAGERVGLKLEEESHGTQRLFAFAGPIHDVLTRGHCLWVDELNTGMHHWLTRALVKMFQDPAVNPRGAQLIFSTHDAAMMDASLFRRDQIWFAEKDVGQGSQLYSLVDIEDKPRKDQPLFRGFLAGRFGGVPQLDDAAFMQWRGGER